MKKTLSKWIVVALVLTMAFFAVNGLNLFNTAVYSHNAVGFYAWEDLGDPDFPPPPGCNSVVYTLNL